MSTTCPSETFRVSILSGPLPTPRRWVMVLRPKPSNRNAREHRRPTSPSKSMPHSKGIGASRFPGRLTVLCRNRQSACRPSPCTRIGPPRSRRSLARRPPVRVPKSNTGAHHGRSHPLQGGPSSKDFISIHHPLQGGEPSSPLTITHHLGAMRPTLFRMAPQFPP